jgi:hypothetical protein
VNDRPIQPFDLERMLLGGLPATFLIEVVLRFLVLYLMLVTALRFMGRRMSSQLTRNELMALVSLAAAIGPALQDPQQGLLPPIVVGIIVVLVQRALAALSVRSHGFETIATGAVTRLVEDGHLKPDALTASQVSRERVLAELRRAGTATLGAVERVYFEPDGTFSVLRAREPGPGLSLVPEWDPALAEREPKDPEHHACVECGATAPSREPISRCPVCGGKTFRPAVHS